METLQQPNSVADVVCGVGAFLNSLNFLNDGNSWHYRPDDRIHIRVTHSMQPSDVLIAECNTKEGFSDVFFFDLHKTDSAANAKTQNHLFRWILYYLANLEQIGKTPQPVRQAA